MRKIFQYLSVVLIFVAGNTWAAEAEDILGLWLTQDGKAKVQMFQCDNKYCGKIVWLKDINYRPGEREGFDGQPRVDHNNPDEKRQNRSILGLQIVKDLQFNDGKWSGGEIYDPKNGKSYRCKTSLSENNKLNIRGYIGFSLFGRTSQWQRVE